MARKSTKSEAGVGNIPSKQVQRSGSPNKVRLHESGYGEPASEGRTKWRGVEGGRDAVGEKEPGKSRGPEGGIPADPGGIEKNRR